MTRLARCRLGVLVLALLWLAWPVPCAAEPEQAGEVGLPQDLARAEFREGSRLAEAGDFARALERYRASYGHFAHATTLYNASYCSEELGDLAGALSDLYEALRLGAEQPARALSPERLALASEAIRSLRSRVAAVALVPTAPETHVLVDGRGLRSVLAEAETYWFVDESGAGRHEALPVKVTVLLNPGTHRVEWRRPGATFAQSVELTAGATVALSWPTSVELAPPRPVAPPPRAPGRVAPRPKAPPEPSGATFLGTTGRVLLFGGGGAVVSGLALGGVALATKSELDARCAPSGACPPGQEDRVTRFREAVRYSNRLFVAGLLAGAAGGTLVWIDSSRRPATTLRVGAGSVTVERRF